MQKEALANPNDYEAAKGRKQMTELCRRLMRENPKASEGEITKLMVQAVINDSDLKRAVAAIVVHDFIHGKSN
jgi:hypothetical protein